MRPPNIVLFLMDDLGWKDVACCGSTFYETPHLDALARRGMRFTQAYASCPVCSPTRASIMTGKAPARVGMTQFLVGHAQGRLLDVPYVEHLPREELSLARALKRGGYATWHVGKWHLGGEPYLPQDHGFDVNIGGCDWGMPFNGYFSPWGIPGMPDGVAGEYLTDHLTDRAIELIRTRQDKPFFLNFWHYAVHVPIEAPPALIRKYEEKAHATGLAAQEALITGERFGCEHKRTEHIVRRIIQSDPAYAAMVENMDMNIGRVLQAIEDAGEADNTIVIFTSDNGGLATAEGSPTCNLPLSEGKGWVYEGGTRVPLIVSWPGAVAEGTTCAVPVTSMDLYPTLLEAAGLDLIPEQHRDGASIVPLLRQDRGAEHGPLFWHYPHYSNQGGRPGCSMREGAYKLIEFFEDGRLALYDLERDEGEQHNLADELPERAADMHARLVSWRAEVEAKIPEVNPHWREEA